MDDIKQVLKDGETLIAKLLKVNLPSVIEEDRQKHMSLHPERPFPNKSALDFTAKPSQLQDHRKLPSYESAFPFSFEDEYFDQYLRIEPDDDIYEVDEYVKVARPFSLYLTSSGKATREARIFEGL